MLRNLPANGQLNVSIDAHVDNYWTVFDRKCLIYLAEIVWSTIVKRCESDAYMACEEQAWDQKLSGSAADSFTQKCVTNAVGAGPRWCVPHYCQQNSDCTGGAGCNVCWAGLCGN